MNVVRYASDKPKDCKFCYYWAGKKGCSLTKERCYYILPPEDDKANNPCNGCPYGRVNPCIGFCMKNILADRKQKGVDRV